MPPISDNPATGPRRRLLFLAGAHKTASSHLQASLTGSAAALRQIGVAPVPPRAMREDLTPVAQLIRAGVAPQVGQGAAEAFLALHAGDARRVVLMDENILGSTDRKMLMRKKRLYPWAHLRLARLLELFPGHDIEIGLALRSPASFLPSCWSESLHHGPIRPFAEFMRGIEPAELRWSRLLERLQAAAPQARITVWRYEDYARLGPRLHAGLLGPEAAARVTPVERVMRRGLSARAVDWLMRQPAPDREALRAARKQYPKAGAEDAFDPWSAQERRALEQAYAEDLRHMARLPGVVCLGFGP